MTARSTRLTALWRLSEFFQRCNYLQVGGEQLLSVQFVYGYPAELLAFEARGFTEPFSDEEKVDLDKPVRIIVLQAHEMQAGLRVYAYFFAELSCQRRLFALVGADFAARKLPQTVKGPVVDALGNQDPAFGITEDAGDDSESL
jgi:hypothetical protein